MVKKQKKLFQLCKKLIATHPYFVVIIFHEYIRNLYPHDPHIKFKIKNPIKRINLLQNQLIHICQGLVNLGHYNIKFKNQKEVGLKTKTGIVYARLWNILSKKENLKSKDYIKERFRNFSNINVNNFFKVKKIIDVGCGGGRYSFALKQLGGQKVYGVDFSDEGIKLAKKNYNLKNLIFRKQDVSNLDFKSNSFDFVYCNGVAHHTTNYKKVIKEIVRICKPGCYIWLFLYGRGGIYWSARKEINKLMKKIPQEYSQKILDMIGMPSNRHIFIDNWYVPREIHGSLKEVLTTLKKLRVTNIQRMKIGRKTDLEYGLKNYKNGKKIWGEGEMRLLIKK